MQTAHRHSRSSCPTGGLPVVWIIIDTLKPTAAPAGTRTARKDMGLQSVKPLTDPRQQRHRSSDPSHPRRAQRPYAGPWLSARSRRFDSAQQQAGASLSRSGLTRRTIWWRSRGSHLQFEPVELARRRLRRGDGRASSVRCVTPLDAATEHARGRVKSAPRANGSIDEMRQLEDARRQIRLSLGSKAIRSKP